MFQPGTTTETLIRFSTVAGERGSPDTWRDPRGFALKFYTDEGNLDIVGNNTPVFFIRDPLKFQHFIRSQKRRADSDLRDNDMQWDFWTLSPESAHQVTWLMGDRGIPRTWRHMNGYGSHTYMWVNAAGREVWVKYHFITDQGIEYFTQAEADRMAGEDADYHTPRPVRGDRARRVPDLDAEDADHAVRGRPRLPVQPLRPHQGVAARRLPADPGRPDGARPQSGPTTSPRSNRAPSSRPTWCRASAPARTRCCWAGCSPTPTRTATASAPNYNQLPVNAPINAGAQLQQGRADAHYHRRSPIRCTRRTPRAAPADTNATASPRLVRRRRDGAHRLRAAREDDDFVQPGTLVRDVMDDGARDAWCDNVTGHLLDRVSEPVLARAYDYWRNIDRDLGNRIEKPSKPDRCAVTFRAPAIRLHRRFRSTQFKPMRR